MVRLQQLWINVRASLWLVPTALVLGMVALALVLIEVDKSVGELEEDWPRLFGAGSEGSREMLGVIAGSMITVAGVTFSVTIVALSQAANLYTPRILRNFMRDRGNQMVIGVFVGVFAYCLLVLRSIRGDDDLRFVPSISVLVGAGLALVGVGFLIYFIHHIARSLLATTVITGITNEALGVIDQLFPESERERDDEDEPSPPGGPWRDVPADKTGYIEAIDIAALVRRARERSTVIRIDRPIGAFVVEGRPLAAIAGREPPDRATCRAIDEAFAIGTVRTMDEDPAFGIEQLVDIAVKALSPSSNDAHTAATVVDYLSAVLARLAARQLDTTRHHDQDGHLRVLSPARRFEDFLAQAFDPIRRNSGGHVAVLSRLVDALGTVAAAAATERRRRAVERQLAALMEMVDRSVPAAPDRAHLSVRIAGILGASRRAA